MPMMLAFEPLTRRTLRIVFDHEHVLGLEEETQDTPADCLVMPGFCDLQVNGAYGIDINAPNLSTDKLHLLCEKFLAEGTTTWLPTVITAAPDAICRQFEILRRACENDPLCAACMPGFHLEGPFLSPLEGARGAHDPAFILPPDIALFECLQAAAGGRIRLVTLAPESAGALDFIRTLTAQGIVAAIGHSLADEETIQAAVGAGAKLSTHLGNGLPAMLPRHHNPLLTQMACDELHASVIFDGHHLPAALRRLLRRAKGIKRLILISDAASLTGLPSGVYREAVGGKVELDVHGRLSLYGTPYLAGAARTLKEDVELTLRDPIFPLADVLRMASENPRRLLGIQQDSLVLFSLNPHDSTITIHLTALDGQIHSFRPIQEI